MGSYEDYKKKIDKEEKIMYDFESRKIKQKTKVEALRKETKEKIHDLEMELKKEEWLLNFLSCGMPEYPKEE